MLPNEKKKATLSILGKLRDRGPFPGEQAASSTDQDVDMLGDILIGTDEELVQAGPAGKNKVVRRKKQLNELAIPPSNVLGAP
jgi:hypothetical protein